LEREALQQSLGALTEVRDSLNAACKIVCTSIDTVERAMAAERLRDGKPQSGDGILLRESA
jgi:hypothetical protein